MYRVEFCEGREADESNRVNRTPAEHVAKNKAEFAKHCYGESQSRQGNEYIAGQLSRRYTAYSTIREIVRDGDTILSVGAGAAYIETVLAKTENVEVTVVDFPEAIATHREMYDRCGLQTLDRDLTRDEPIVEGPIADIVLSCEE